MVTTAALLMVLLLGPPTFFQFFWGTDDAQAHEEGLLTPMPAHAFHTFPYLSLVS